jgi:hypothetical protein
VGLGKVVADVLCEAGGTGWIDVPRVGGQGHAVLLFWDSVRSRGTGGRGAGPPKSECPSSFG